MNCLKRPLLLLCKGAIPFALLALSCMVNIQAYSQTISIDNASFQAGPFGASSTIGVPLKMSGCYKWNNTLRLYLCNPSNTAGVLIGTYNQTGSFSTFINGRIPNGTPARTDYYLEVRTDRPVTGSNASAIFEIKTTTAPVAFVNTIANNRRLIDSLFYGYCSGNQNGVNSPSRSIMLVNQSSDGATTTASYKDENTGVVTNLVFPAALQGTVDVPLNVTYYSLFTKAEKDGVISTRYVYLYNPTFNGGLGQSGELKACLPDPLEVAVDITRSKLGIRDNFPGAYYTFDYDDAGKNDTLTYCELMASGGIVSHTYTQNSCNRSVLVGGEPRPVYAILERYINPLKRPGVPDNCDEPPNTSYAWIFRKPEANFTHPDKGCVGRMIKFKNTSVTGLAQNGKTCTSAEEYAWYIGDDPVPVSNARDLDFPFPTPGTYKVKLKVENGSCAPSEKESTICIEPVPVPDFTMNNLQELSGCADLVFKIQNLTNANPCGNAFKWIVYNDATGAVVDPKSGVYGITPGDSDAEPGFVFHKSGKFRVELQVTNTCGVYKVYKYVTVTGSAGLVFPKDTGYCNTGLVIDYRTNGNHKPTYFSNLGSETYSWTVTGGNFSFENGTTASDAYPVIRFIDNAVYAVTVQVTSPCGTGTATQRINFSLPVTVDAVTRLIENCYSPTIALTLSGKVTGVVSGVQWTSNGSGSFNVADRADVVYMLSEADKKNTNLYLVFKAVAPPGSACGELADTVRIKTFPNNTGANVIKAICSGEAVNHTPVSTVASGSFTWVSSLKSGTVTGNSTSGAGNITDVLVNAGNVSGVVEYLITPYANGCEGEPFTLTVTVYPKPVLDIDQDPGPACNNRGAGIRISGVLPGTVISWRSFVTAGTLAGNSDKVKQAATVIDDLLLNRGTANATVVYRIAPVLNDCVGDTVEVVVVVLPDGAQATAGENQTLCDGTTEADLAATPASGIGAIGSWSLPPGYTALIVDPSRPDTKVTGLSAGKYPFVWTLDNKGCPPSRDTVWITVLPGIVNEIKTTPIAICPKEPVDIQGAPPGGGAGNYTYRWQQSRDNNLYYDIPGETSIDLKANPATNVYFRRVVYSLHCNKASDPVLVTIKPLPVVGVAIDPLEGVCPGDAVTFTLTSLSGDLLYSYYSRVTEGAASGNSSGILLSNPVFSDVLKTNGADSAFIAYEFVPFSDGCPGDLQTILVKVLPGVTKASAGKDQVICATNETVLKGNVPVRGNGRWRQISGPAAVVVDPSSTTTFVTQLQPGMNYSFAWEIAASGLACGFSADTVAVFVRRPTTVARAGNDSTTCALTIDQLPLMGNTPAVHETGHWAIVSTNMVPMPQLVTPDDERCVVRNLSKGTLTLRWTITSDAIDCPPSSDVKTIIVGAVTYIADAGVDRDSCNVSSFMLKGNEVAGVPGFWSVVPGSVATIASPFTPAVMVTNVRPGIYHFVYTLDNGVCPADRDTVAVTVLEELDNILNATERTICYKESVLVAGQPATGASGVYRYQWQQSIDNISYSDMPGETGLSLQVTPLTTTWYRRVVYAPPCTKISETVLITVRDPITNNTIAGDQTICVNTTAEALTGNPPVGGSGTYLYQWQSSTDNSTWTSLAGEIFATLKPGKITQTTWYRRKVKASLCPELSEVTSNVVRISVNPDAKAAFSHFSGCAPLIINAANLNAQLYFELNSGWVWLRDGVVKSNGPIYPTDTLKDVRDTANITLIAISKFGCKNDTITHGFSTGLPPIVELGKGDSVMAGTSVQIHPEITNGPIKKIEWTPAALIKEGTVNPWVTINNELLIGVKVTNAYCSASDTVRYKAYCHPDQLDLPTAFSPNGDGINDVLRVRGAGATNISLMIYDRWGQKVFEKHNIRPNVLADGWDGKFNGRIVQEVYTYRLTATCTAGLLFRKQGNVFLKL